MTVATVASIAPTVASLTPAVLWATFAVCLVFGAILARTHFCTMGAVADIVNMGDWTRMRMWALAIGVATLGFNGLVAAGLVDATQTLYASTRVMWLAALVGGLMFGFGMVLASGCGSKTLVRIGQGSLKSLVVFVVLGIAAFATLKGITAIVRVATVDQAFLSVTPGQDLPGLLGASLGLARPQAAMWIGGALGLAITVWALASNSMRNTDALLGGLGAGLSVAAVWFISGKLGFLPEDPETLKEAFVATNSGRIESLSFVAPFAYVIDWLMFFSDKSKVLTLGMVSVFGTVLGSAAYSLASGTFRWEGFAGAEDTANHLVGAVLMGIGGVTAMGCTVGQGLSAISTLTLASFVAVAAIIAGAVLALKYQMWRLEQMG